MKHLLLLGAGFSRNWGGLLANEVFDDLLSRPGIAANEYLRAILWRHRENGGFEGALEEVQHAFKRDPGRFRDHLSGFQSALKGVFDSMNRAFFELRNFDINNHIGLRVSDFLVRFDAIFTLNQDVLLEHHYLPKLHLASGARWNGPQLPGMRRVPSPGPSTQPSWGRDEWVPASDYRLQDRCQPYFKLHGSSNWRDTENGTLLVIGGNKVGAIGANAVLSAHFNQFREMISAPDTRLLIIGYGFRDEHINNAIVESVERHGLKLFVVDPYGSGIARRVNRSSGAAGFAKGPLDEAFERGLIGASTRALSETFGTDRVSYEAVMRFFV